MTSGPDGNVWCVEADYADIESSPLYYIKRITPSGTATAFSVPNNSEANGVTTGSDGNLWFTSGSAHSIFRLTLSGIFTQFTMPAWDPIFGSGIGQPLGIAAGTNGELWFTDHGQVIGNLSNGVFAEYPPFGNLGGLIAAGPDGTVSFVGGDHIYRIESSDPPISGDPGTSLGGVIGSFLDADPLAEAADFTAVIDWGDNTTSSGTISDNAVAGFDVSGTHVYATGGKYRIVVDITDSGGSTTISRNTATVYAPPQSSVGALPTHEPATFAVKWSGAPGIGASSISSYDVFVSDSGGLFAPFMHATTATSAMFTGVNGHSYGFYSVATDDRGNVEPTPSNAQAVTRVDAAAPTSKVAALPAISGQSFTVAWSGGDDNGGSGIASYDVFVSDNGGSFTPWQTATTASSAAFMGMTGHTYSFYSVATDKVGNHQPTPNGAQAATTVPAPIVLPSSSVAALPPLSPTTFTVSWSGSDAGGPGIATYDVFVSDNGGSFTAFETATTAASATFTGVSGHSYGFYSVATDKVGNRQPPPTVAQASTQIVTAPAPPVAVGDTWVLGPGNASSGFDTTGVLKNDVSVDGHPENVVSTLTTGVSHGQLTLNSDGSFSYAADSTFKGIDRFAYQDSEGGTHGNIVGVTLLSYNASLVDKLYHQVLHRSAEDQGLIYWATQLDAGAHLDAVATDIFNSSERLNPLVTQFYEQYLLRGTDPDGLAYWVHAWQSKGDPRDVVESILASPEFFDDAGDTSVGFVALLYQRVLQRNAEQTGLGYWVSLMSNPPTDPPQTRFQIASQFYDTHEKHVGLVDFLFGEYFNGVSPLPSIEPYVADLDFPSNQTETQVEKAIIDSPEYSNAPPEPSAGAVGRAMYDH